MSLRRLIAEADVASMNVAEFCASHGISRWFFYELRRRYARHGEAGLVPRSRAPETVANKTPGEVMEAIVRARKELGDAGWDAGAGSIRDRLAGLVGVPSESTIWRILRAGGHVLAQPAKAPKRSRRRFTMERANQSWQLDDTEWALADGTKVKILNVIDDHSRLLVAARALPNCTGEAALVTVTEATELVGWPERIQSDNATAFRHILAKALAELGVGACHSRPNNPRCNGKVERLHQTEQRWLTAQPAADTIDQLQGLLDLFRHLYNHQRPHRALGRRTPAQVWSQAPKSGPANRALNITTTVHHDKVNCGYVCAGRYKIAVGRRHEGQPALIVTTGLTAHVFIASQLARKLTLNPTRRLQPLASTAPPATTHERDDPRHV